MASNRMRTVRIWVCIKLGVSIFLTKPGLFAVDFSKDVRRILSENCFECHGPDNEARKAGLRLDTQEGAHSLHEGKRAITPGDLNKSELWSRIITSDPDEIMPPPESKKFLTAKQKKTLRQWIEEGGEYAEHWAFQHPSKTNFGDLFSSVREQNPIDTLVRRKLDSIGLGFSKEAEPEKLVRRLHLDLLGLPPSISEIEEFVEGSRNGQPDFYHNYVDKLLRASDFGEKWARQWLDLARYADSNGFQADQLRDSWAYRDWVIGALNSNMPYDQFTIEQLAGDLLPSSTLDQKVATGFHRTVTCNVEAGVHAEKNRVDQVFDRVNTTGTVWLGLTLECAQCHNHKYDPISTDEYYSLFAYFNNTPLEVELPSSVTDVQHNFIGPYLTLPMSKVRIEQKEKLKIEIHKLEKALSSKESDPKKGLEIWIENQKSKREQDLDKALMKILSQPKEKWTAAQEKKVKDQFYLSAAETKQLKKNLDKVKAEYESIRAYKTLVMEELDQKRVTRVMKRGNYQDPLHEVKPGTLDVLHKKKPDYPDNRFGLAQWITDKENPLTARVAVNRVWAEIWGRGIVRTLEDFGMQSEPPSDPVLLDWLATYYMDCGWDLKALLKVICTSRTYKQTSRVSPEIMSIDPENKFFSRGARYRLDAESIRDSMLASSGLLAKKMFGPPVMPYQPTGVWRAVGRNAPVWREMKNEDRWRKGIYIVYRRAAPYPSMVNFDAPDRSACTVSRPRTNTPLQALTLMNDPAFIEMAIGLTDRVLRESGQDDFASRLEMLYLLSLSRKPSPKEAEYLKQAFDRHLNEFQKDRDRALNLISQKSVFYKPEVKDAAEFAAWFLISTSILNLDETVTKG